MTGYRTDTGVATDGPTGAESDRSADDALSAAKVRLAALGGARPADAVAAGTVGGRGTPVETVYTPDPSRYSAPVVGRPSPIGTFVVSRFGGDAVEAAAAAFALGFLFAAFPRQVRTGVKLAAARAVGIGLPVKAGVLARLIGFGRR